MSNELMARLPALPKGTTMRAPLQSGTDTVYYVEQMREYAVAAIEANAATCKWLPIDTAPKTSSAILVWVPENFCTYAVTWHVGDTGRRAGWVIFGGDWREHIQHATLWMPLPTPTEGL